VIVMRILNLCIAVLVLVVAVGLIVAEPKHVDGGWHRSDEVPRENLSASTATSTSLDDGWTLQDVDTEVSKQSVLTAPIILGVIMVVFGIILTILLIIKRQGVRK